ncbi:MAG: hypothetical protein QM750_11850 [Rubrivivax sp.]
MSAITITYTGLCALRPLAAEPLAADASPSTREQIEPSARHGAAALAMRG